MTRKAPNDFALFLKTGRTFRLTFATTVTQGMQVTARADLRNAEPRTEPRCSSQAQSRERSFPAREPPGAARSPHGTQGRASRRCRAGGSAAPRPPLPTRAAPDPQQLLPGRRDRGARTSVCHCHRPRCVTEPGPVAPGVAARAPPAPHLPARGTEPLLLPAAAVPSTPSGDAPRPCPGPSLPAEPRRCARAPGRAGRHRVMLPARPAALGGPRTAPSPRARPGPSPAGLSLPGASPAGVSRRWGRCGRRRPSPARFPSAPPGAAVAPPMPPPAPRMGPPKGRGGRGAPGRPRGGSAGRGTGTSPGPSPGTASPSPPCWGRARPRAARPKREPHWKLPAARSPAEAAGAAATPGSSARGPTRPRPAEALRPRRGERSRGGTGYRPGAAARSRGGQAEPPGGRARPRGHPPGGGTCGVRAAAERGVTEPPPWRCWGGSGSAPPAWTGQRDGPLPWQRSVTSERAQRHAP